VSDRDAVDEYGSVHDGPEIEHRVKGSRFLGRALHLSREEELPERLEPIRRTHHAARHHCWAARVGPPGGAIDRADDDGEPTGTGGQPILRQIDGRELHDVVVVVTRYFGGTKLGTGGLARAYGEAAAQALDACPSRVIHVDRELIVDLAFDDLGPLETVLARAGDGIRRVERRYEPQPRMTLYVRPSREREIAAAIVEATAGRARVSRA
jgi:uncharacterized YigZ family protein